MNPAVTMTGDLSSVSQLNYVTRRITTYLTRASTVNVSPSSLQVKDGAKILSVKASSITGRTLTVTVPNGSVMVVNDGSSTAPFGGTKKTIAAPLSRFPTIKVHIPDLLAAPLNSDSTETMFSVASDGGSSDFTYRITYTAKYLA
jgi:hypothetical protein